MSAPPCALLKLTVSVAPVIAEALRMTHWSMLPLNTLIAQALSRTQVWPVTPEMVMPLSVLFIEAVTTATSPAAKVTLLTPQLVPLEHVPELY
jgi:hypothetical protein